MNEQLIKITTATDTDASIWDEYVDNHAGAKIYHQYSWKSLIKVSFGHQGQYFVAKDREGNVCGVLPIIYMQNPIFGKIFGKNGISMPYFNYGGPLGDSNEIEEQLIAAAAKYFRDTDAESLEFRDTKERPGYPVKTEKITMILPLLEDPDEMFNSFKAKLRSQIRRPIREGVIIQFGGKEYIDDFYDVFCENMRDLGTPPYSKAFFLNILNTFPKNAYLAIAKKDDEAVGCAFLIGFNDMLEIPWASTLRKYNSIGVNMLMYSEVIKSAIERKYKYFDFGRCSRGAGTHKFKKQWGSEEKQLYWHYSLLKMDKLPEVNPNNPKFELFINTWQKLPVSVTRLFGPHIVKHIS